MKMNTFRLKLLLIIYFLFIVSFISCRPLESKSPPIEKQGQISEVKLLEVKKLDKETLEQKLPGAFDGLVFFFLITKKPGVTGDFTVQEFRDFQINQSSYSKISREKLKKHIEPQTIIESFNNFFYKERGDLIPFIEDETHENSVVMITYIGGSRLPKRENIVFSIYVGWNKEIELFEFEVPFPLKHQIGKKKIFPLGTLSNKRRLFRLLHRGNRYVDLVRAFFWVILSIVVYRKFRYDFLIIFVITHSIFLFFHINRIYDVFPFFDRIINKYIFVVCNILDILGLIIFIIILIANRFKICDKKLTIISS